MAEDQIKTLVRDVYVKQSDGTFGEPTYFGVTFDNVIDQRSRINLTQFYNNYLDFMKTNAFLAYGANEPTNTHARIWIDTSHNNFDNIG